MQLSSSALIEQRNQLPTGERAMLLHLQSTQAQKEGKKEREKETLAFGASGFGLFLWVAFATDCASSQKSIGIWPARGAIGQLHTLRQPAINRKSRQLI